MVFLQERSGSFIGRSGENSGRTTDPDEWLLVRRYGINDLGYPRVVRRKDGKMVAIYYYYSTKAHLHHLRASIWQP